MKLRYLNLRPSQTPEEIYNSLNDYLDESRLTSLPLRIQVKRLFYRKMNEQNWEETCHVPWLAIFTKIIEHKLSKLSTADCLIFRRDRLLARFITPTQVVDELQRLAKMSTYQKPSYGLVIEGESETVEHDQEEHVTDNEVEEIDDVPVEKRIENKEEISPIEALFRSTVHTFNDEMAKSKKTLIDAQVMIKTLKKDFSRFEEIKVLRTVDAIEKRQAPDLSRLKVQIKKSERKKVSLHILCLLFIFHLLTIKGLPMT